MGLFDKLKETLSEQVGVNIPSLSPKKTNSKPIQTTPVAPTPATPVPPAPTSGENIYSAQLEQLIDMALADGELTEKEKQVLFKRAQSMGIDLDEFEMVLDARLYKMSQQQNTTPTTTSAPKSEKHGDVKKCPACGAMIVSFSVSCPECGYQFTNIEANSSIQKLFEMLNQAEAENKEAGFFDRLYQVSSTSKKQTIIQNFPIPTTKEDILEFLSLAVPLARKPGMLHADSRTLTLYPTWKAKCEQIIMKAKFSMRNDKEVMGIIAEYAKELKIKM